MKYALALLKFLFFGFLAFILSWGLWGSISTSITLESISKLTPIDFFVWGSIFILFVLLDIFCIMHALSPIINKPSWYKGFTFGLLNALFVAGGKIPPTMMAPKEKEKNNP